ncbi:hypothetical protein ONZ45_g16341 [Pleurotus djamor]|nr:hypothetical protein ONZ45_g16341 [Pleurotus djamor]
MNSSKSLKGDTSSPQATTPSDVIAKATQLSLDACRSFAVFQKYFKIYKASKPWHAAFPSNSPQEDFYGKVAALGNTYMTAIRKTCDIAESFRANSSSIISGLENEDLGRLVVPQVRLQISAMHRQASDTERTLEDTLCPPWDDDISIKGCFKTWQSESYAELEARADEDLHSFAESVLEQTSLAISAFLIWWNERVLHCLVINEGMKTVAFGPNLAESELFAASWSETESECASYIEVIKLEHELMEGVVKGVIKSRIPARTDRRQS